MRSVGFCPHIGSDIRGIGTSGNVVAMRRRGYGFNPDSILDCETSSQEWSLLKVHGPPVASQSVQILGEGL